MIDKLEQQLDSFDADERKEALLELAEMVKSGKIALSAVGSDTNMHFHSFYSYNAYGYSPSKIAWLAKKRGLAAAGIVDFDVLDGLEEFYEACAILGLKGACGMESRVHIPEFAEFGINSPGEPGISYHMGAGYPAMPVDGEVKAYLSSFLETARARNVSLVERVNAFLSPLELDYDSEVCQLTPSNNATERHICLAYAKKAAAMFAGDELGKFWAEKLGVDTGELDLPEGPKLQGLIRAKTMKKGGAGYVKPDAGQFPLMAKVNEFTIAAGGIPMLTWLDGTSDGEQKIEELLEVAMACKTAAVNIVPDRNFTPGVKDDKLANLQQIVALTEKLDLPVIAGTEMNSPGLKFVDDFGCEELAPLGPVFLRGAMIIYAHGALMRNAGIGYLGDWADKNFESRRAKNDFFEELGTKLEPGDHDKLKAANASMSAGEVLGLIG